MLSGSVPLPVAYEVTVQNDNSEDVRLSEESSDSTPASPAQHGTETLKLSAQLLY